jgi:invasion protein IalB
MRSGWRNGLMIAAAVMVPLATGAQAQSADAWEPPMALGRPLVVEGHAGKQTQRTSASLAQKCGKWRRIADRLGETYAGVRLRQSVVTRVCAFADLSPTEKAVWSWPWGRGDIDAELPPRLHGTFGAWTIRCDAAGNRERCALIHSGLAQLTPPLPKLDSVRVITHFVIDDIGGQEKLLWRVFVERARPQWFVNATASRLQRAANPGVLAQAGATAIAKPFDSCSRLGCLMEAEVDTGGSVATRLAEGVPLQLDVQPLSGYALSQTVSADGFQAGLGALSQLKRQERRMLAGR